MNILIAPNAFKHSLSSTEVGRAIVEGLDRSRLEGKFSVLPIADGGDGSLTILARALSAEIKSLQVNGPLGSPVLARYAINKKEATGIVELAEASGIRYLSEKELNPWKANTYGTGEIVNKLVLEGCKKIYLTVGGSASVDGGIGILSALGARFFAGKELLTLPVTEDILRITRIDASGLKTGKCKFILLTDVQNKLLGKNGAVSVFGPQKGVKPDEISEFEGIMKYWSKLLAQDGRDVTKLTGGGASGGVPAGLWPFLDLDIRSGGNEILDLTGFHELLSHSDVVITAEGRIDAQTGQGKGPGLVAKYASEKGIPVIGLCGIVSEDYDSASSYFTSVWSINRRLESLGQALVNTRRNLLETSIQLGNLLQSKIS